MGFLLIQKENNNSNMLCKFGDLKYQKMKKVANTPSPSDFDDLPYLRVRWYPHFFHQNNRKGCKRDYIYAPDHFL